MTQHSGPLDNKHQSSHRASWPSCGPARSAKWPKANAIVSALAVSMLSTGIPSAVAQLTTPQASKTVPAAPVASNTQPAQSAAPSPPEVTGVWIDHTGRGAIEITPCGTRVCGYVYWVKEPASKSGRPVLDVKNPDPKQRNKPMCGAQILVELSRQNPQRFGHVWGAGKIYNPEDGDMFDAEIKLISANELSVLGYLGLKFMGETFTWRRAPADLQRCGPARA